jgi:hypothetical protein
MVELGSRVRDRINGFVGIATGRAEYLFGCRQVLVAPESLPGDGKHPESHWLDEDHLELVEAGVISPGPAAQVSAGGPLTGPTPPGR